MTVSPQIYSKSCWPAYDWEILDNVVDHDCSYKQPTYRNRCLTQSCGSVAWNKHISTHNPNILWVEKQISSVPRGNKYSTRIKNYSLWATKYVYTSFQD